MPEEEERRQEQTKEMAKAANREEEEREAEAERRDLEELARKYDGEQGDAEVEDDDGSEAAEATGELAEGGSAAAGNGASGGAADGKASADGAGTGIAPTPAQLAAKERRARRKQREKERTERIEKIASLEAELRQARADAFVESIAAAHAEALPEHSASFRGCLTSRWLGLVRLQLGSMRPLPHPNLSGPPQSAHAMRSRARSVVPHLSPHASHRLPPPHPLPPPVAQHFSLYDGGLKQEHVSKGFPFVPREELCAVAYASNLLKSRPHSMTVVVKDAEAGAEEEVPYSTPAPTGSGGDAGAVGAIGGSIDTNGSSRGTSTGGGGGGGGARSPSRSIAHEAVNEIVGDIDTTSMRTAAASIIGGGSGSLLERKMSGKTEGLHILRNQMPDWDPKLEAFTLPFYQRVSLPSKKNVHVVRPEAPDDIVLLFGKRAKSEDGMVTTFSLDFCRPLSTLAAFATALTSFFGSE